MNEIDLAFKSIVGLSPKCIMDLIFGRNSTARLKEVTDPQINLPEFRADKALVIKSEGVVSGIICEAMLQPKTEDLAKFLLKSLGLRYVTKHPAVVVVIYLKKGRYVTFPDGFEVRVGPLVNQFKISRILLWEHEDRILSGELKEFVPFLPLFHKHPSPKIMDEQKRILTQIKDEKLRADVTSLTVVVDLRIFAKRVVLKKFKREAHMIKETSMVQGWLNKSEKVGERRGERKGKLSLLERMLSQKFGKLPSKFVSGLNTLDDKQLDKLSLVILQAQSWKEVEAWMKNGATKKGTANR